MAVDNETQFQVSILPDAGAHKIYSRLVGLDKLKARLEKEARILLNPSLLKDWHIKFHHGKLANLVDAMVSRPPLFLFVGDVGTGKTALAETFGDQVGRDEKLQIFLYRMSLNARGSGAVGEMTQLLTDAFKEIVGKAKEFSRGGKSTAGVVLLIDEADALAQSRELSQMHHEDRAGVNALIRGLDDIGKARVPVIVVMCSNRLSALDPAVRRRAAAVFEFTRPDFSQRLAILEPMFLPAGFTQPQLENLAITSGPHGDRDFGFTYSDFFQKLFPATLMESFPDQPINYETTMRLLAGIHPTPPFVSEQS